MKRGNRFIDLTGKRFGTLAVVRLDTQRANNLEYKWICRCDCGRKLSVTRGNIQGQKSCGCANLGRTTHGMRRTPEYNVWCCMKSRCGNQNDIGWKRYGGRGIKVCDRWLNSFESFFEDMGNRPTPKHTLERKNNDGNYEPSNCIWELWPQQCNNRRSNRMVCFNGKTQNVTRWSKELGISFSALIQRLNRGWLVEDAFSTAAQSRTYSN